ncbi:carbon-nitrogen hydrolase family protein [Thermotalea metallivorans]|uniref:(R)-stereoselective amidase n=1 Tax=Thermotalea metallivorans TaxID=520762 RepID=A0A140L141_9FIRM|nr:carbon-nitrogen hydrolase family protein [Thermotalea metallivorans]KXG74266.1 (R)-stereoselective amidase [Thermotalea metallivorans]
MKEHIAACVQIAVEPNEIGKNIDKCCLWLERAVKEYEAELVVFPESITTGFTPSMEVEAFYEILEPIPGKHVEKIQRLAKDLGVHVVFPLYERGYEKGTIYNSSILIDDQGEMLGHYRKTHPFPTERLEGGGWTTPGSETVVVDTKLGKIGMMICYDGDFPELSRVLALKGAEIITRPSALLRSYDIWETINKARAYDNHVYILAANGVGPDGGENYFFGHSMIVSPIAQVLALARGTEEIIAAKLDPNPIRYVSYGTKSPMIFDHLEDRNVKVYKEILQEGKSPFEPARRIPYRK